MNRHANENRILGNIDRERGKVTTTAPSFFQRHRDKIAFAGPDECWLWTAGRSSNGYGTVQACGKTRGAHREAYEANRGAGAAAGLLVRHRCDVKLCVNPAHLEIGTFADNNRDRDERGRQVTPRGVAHGSAKLTEDDVRTIRATYVPRSREFSTYALARRFGVCAELIGFIVRRKLWVHVA